MAGGPILPSSIYVGGASGNLTVNYYIPGVNTNGAGAIESVMAVGSMPANSPCVLQFNLPPVIPPGTFKLRILAWANASSGNSAKIDISDGQTAPNNNIGATTLGLEGTSPSVTVTWGVGDADDIKETKINLTTIPAANNIFTVLANYLNAGWNLTQISAWQYSLIWE